MAIDFVKKTNAQVKTAKAEQVDEQTPKKRGKKPNVKILFLTVLMLAGFGAAAFFWNDARQAKQQSVGVIEEKNKQETEQVTTTLAQQLLIEGNDKPTVARVEKPEALKASNKEFYKNVQTGDYLVLYPQRAIIYRLSEKKIINIAPIINTAGVDAKTQSSGATTPAQ